MSRALLLKRILIQDDEKSFIAMQGTTWMANDLVREHNHAMNLGLTRLWRAFGTLLLALAACPLAAVERTQTGGPDSARAAETGRAASERDSLTRASGGSQGGATQRPCQRQRAASERDSLTRVSGGSQGGATQRPPAQGTLREVRVVMGTSAEIEVGGLDRAPATAALEAAFKALDRVDDSMSLWKDSELTRLNQTGSGQASSDLMAVLAHALDVARASGGAFDPTIEPFVRAGGGTGQRRRTLSQQERRALLRRVGVEHVHLDATSGAVRLDPGTTLDFGGIAKGYAADLALAALRGVGARRGFVDLGSSSIGGFGAPLTLDIRDPERSDRAPWGSFSLRDGHVSTSGDDQRPGHILDPRSGQPVHQVLSATVVATSGIEADALSTALFVLGATDGLALLVRRGAAGLVLLREKGHAVIRTTPGFASAYALEPAANVVVRE